MTASEMALKRWENARQTKTPEQISEAARNAVNERWGRTQKKAKGKPRRKTTKGGN